MTFSIINPSRSSTLSGRGSSSIVPPTNAPSDRQVTHHDLPLPQPSSFPYSRSFDSFIRHNTNFDPELINSIRQIFSGVDPKMAGAQDILIGLLNIYPEVQATVRFIIENCGSSAYNNLIELCDLLNLPEFRPEWSTLLMPLIREGGASVLRELRIALFRNPSLFTHLPDILANYEEGKALAQAIVPSVGDIAASTFLSFAYAITILGEPASQNLYEQFGIEYFMRYTPATLQAAAANSDIDSPDQRPLLLVVFNKADHNGTFYREGAALEPLNRYYRMLIVEVNSEAEFIAEAREIAGTYGQINTLIIGGHGTPGDINLGGIVPTDENSIDLSDEISLIPLRHIFAENARVILISCSTGENENAIGGRLSRYWDVDLIAPAYDSGSADYILSPEGEIISVRFDVITNQFASGDPFPVSVR